MVVKPGRVIWCDRGWMPTYYGFCPSESAWKREMRRLGIKRPLPEYPTSDARTSHFEKNGKDQCLIVTLAERLDKRGRLGIVALLVHEATHVWQAIRRDIQEEEPSAEFEAYAMQNIALQLCLAYSNTRKRLG